MTCTCNSCDTCDGFDRSNAFVGMKIDLWKSRPWHESAQLLILQRYTLLVTDVSDRKSLLGTVLENNESCRYDLGPAWSLVEDDTRDYTPALWFWSYHYKKQNHGGKLSLRALLYKKHEIITPSGDVDYCKEHNYYFYKGQSCEICLAR